MRSLSGLNLAGMLSQLLRPITTAFGPSWPAGRACVTRAKYAISFDSRHGSEPLFPIPFRPVAATTNVIPGCSVAPVSLLQAERGRELCVTFMSITSSVSALLLANRKSRANAA